jgi:hypothetical protein
MLEQEFIEKVSVYLEKIYLTPVNGNITYSGIRENAPQADGTTKDMHVMSFVIDFDNDSPYGEKPCAIYIDVITKKLELLVTPYYMDTIQ